MMQSDTRKLLRAGASILFVGAAAAGVMFYAGGVTRQGPHTNTGWLSLIVTMGCLPTGTLTLLLGFSKWMGDRKR